MSQVKHQSFQEIMNDSGVLIRSADVKFELSDVTLALEEIA